MLTQGFIFSSNVSTQIGVLISEIYFYKNTKEEKNKKIARVTDKHCVEKRYK